MNRVLRALGVCFLVFLPAVLSAEEPKSALEIGEQAPTFSLPNQEGAPVNLSELSGNITVLEWMNPRCPFTQRHYKAQTMAKIAAKYHEKGVRWYAINSTHDQDSIENQRVLREYGVPYMVLSDIRGEVGKLYGAKTTPHIFIIDRDGRLAYKGAIDDDPDGEKKGNAKNFADQALRALVEYKRPAITETKSYGCSVKYAG